MGFIDFMQAFNRTYFGRVILINAFNGIELGLHEKDITAELFKKCYEEFILTPLYTGVDYPSLEKFCDYFSDYVRDKTPLFGSNNYDTPVAPQDCSFVVTVKQLFHNYKEDRVFLAWDDASHVLDTVRSSPHCSNSVAYYEELRKSRTTRMGHFADLPEFGGKSQTTWYTVDSNVGNLLGLFYEDDTASLVRNLLGLSHFCPGFPGCWPDIHEEKYLILYKIPRSLLHVVEDARPTFFESLGATKCSRFQVKSDVSSERHSSYGKTVDLNSLRSDTGARERVFRPKKGVDYKAYYKEHSISIEAYPLGFSGSACCAGDHATCRRFLDKITSDCSSRDVVKDIFN